MEYTHKPIGTKLGHVASLDDWHHTAISEGACALVWLLLAMSAPSRCVDSASGAQDSRLSARGGVLTAIRVDASTAKKIYGGARAMYGLARCSPRPTAVYDTGYVSTGS